jgi:hypothetical protein
MAAAAVAVVVAVEVVVVAAAVDLDLDTDSAVDKGQDLAVDWDSAAVMVVVLESEKDRD